MRTTMRSLLALVVVVIGLSFGFSPSAYAGHDLAYAEFRVFRGDVEVSFNWAGAGCLDTFCLVTILGQDDGDAVAMRDALFFERWCGGNPITVQVAPGTSNTQFACTGSGPWRIEGLAGLRRDGDNTHLATHDSTVSITIRVEVTR